MVELDIPWNLTRTTHPLSFPPLLTALIQQCHNVVDKITCTDSKGKNLRGKNQYIKKKFFFFENPKVQALNQYTGF